MPILVDTPDSLLEAITVKSPLERLRVRGIVVDLAPYPRQEPKWIYGRLRGIAATIGFRCDIDSAPTHEGTSVILEGRIQVKPSKFRTGLEVMLYGETVGSWEGRQRRPIPSVHLRRERPRMSLRAFLGKHHATELLLVATARGFQDFTAVDLPIELRHWRWHKANFGDRNQLLRTLRALPGSAPAGVALLRGGSADASMELWNDPEVVRALLEWRFPYYTAIGHSDQLLLADKFADGAFTTPSAFGHEVRNSLLDTMRYDNIVRRCVRQIRIWKVLCLLLASLLLVLSAALRFLSI